MKIKKYIHLYCESGVVPVSNGMDDFFNIMARLTTEEFIERARKVHGDKYDYSKVEYINSKTKVCIICPNHGIFWQTPNSHLGGNGCPMCSGNKKMTTDEFIERSKEIHNNKYDYSKVKYEGIFKKVCIICPEHGEFWQEPNHHLRNCGCPKCVGKYTSTIDFINKSKKIHSDKYDYSKVDYVRANKKVCIICPEHGEFWQTPNSHLNGKGCPMCSRNKKMDTKEFIRRAKEIHNDKYDYSKVKYVNAHSLVQIVCPIHGEFWQNPNNHIYNHRGCPKCYSSMLENVMRKKLSNLNIEFIEQKTFDWLVYKDKLRLDFYLPKHNIAIECQGIQHFEPVDVFGGINEFKECKYRDKLKKDLCNKYNVNLLYFNYDDDINEFEQKLKEYGIH